MHTNKPIPKLSLAAAFALTLLMVGKTEAQSTTTTTTTTTTPAAPSPGVGAPQPNDQVVVMTPFDVNGGSDKGYLSTNSAGITRLDESVENLPVDVQIFNPAVIQDMAVSNVLELGRFMVASQDHASAYDYQFDMRGFTSQVADDGERDGFRFTGRPNLYNIDRIEVLLGPVSVVQGAADPGGQVNEITKSAKTRQNFTEVDGSAGSFGVYRAAIDDNFSTRSASGHNDLAIRVNATIENDPTFIKFSEDNWEGVAVALRDDYGSDTSVEVKYEYLYEHRVPWANIADRWSGAPGLKGGFDMNLNRQIPQLYDYNEANATDGPQALEKHADNYLEALATHRFTDELNVQLIGEGSSEQMPEYLTPSNSPTIGYNSTTNSYYVNRAYSWTTTSDDRFNFRGLVNYDLNLGWTDQKIIAGFSDLFVRDYTLQDNLYSSATNAAVVDQTPLFPGGATVANYAIPLAGRYWGAIAPVQDHVDTESSYLNSSGSYFGGRVRTVVGYAWNSTTRTDYTFPVPKGSFYGGSASKGAATSSINYTQKAQTPMLSVIVAITPNINFYADDSKSFKPQTAYYPTINLVTGAATGSLGPQEGSGYEAGFKFDYTRTTGFSGSIDAYNVAETNVAQVLSTVTVASLLGQAASLNQRYYVAGTTQTDTGAEVQLFYNPSPSITVYANYSYSSAFITQSLTSPALVGEEANDHSKNDVSMFGKYTFIDGPLQGWFLGPTVYGHSRYYRIQANEYGYNAGYLIADAFAGYSGVAGNLHYTVQLNLKNVFNKIYVRTYALIGDPREWTISARLKF